MTAVRATCSRGEGASAKAAPAPFPHLPASLELGSVEALADLKAIGDDLAAAAAAAAFVEGSAPGDGADVGRDGVESVPHADHLQCLEQLDQGDQEESGASPQ